MDDEHLIAAVAAGDDRALRELFNRHAPSLAARLRRLLPAATVEDVLQETFIAVWCGASGYSARGEPAAWALVVLGGVTAGGGPAAMVAARWAPVYLLLAVAAVGVALRATDGRRERGMGWQ